MAKLISITAGLPQEYSFKHFSGELKLIIAITAANTVKTDSKVTTTSIVIIIGTGIVKVIFFMKKFKIKSLDKFLVNSVP